ncbi:MAG: ABC transporter ATP-binding protein, partial [Saprospiraceae bacterium]|nr:ABC transporter ATP-binding protein [Saprospiraceae bacterium]
GKKIAMIFQEPMTSLNPVFTCGSQVAEMLMLHKKLKTAEAKSQTLELFNKVGLPDPNRIYKAYPHQLSGGQKQRVMIAMAISCEPDLLIADEPTTALDVTVQKTILDLLLKLKEESGLSMIFISHDLGVIAEICNKVVVMRNGKVVEHGEVKQVLNSPEHAYTKGLLACRPTLNHKLKRLPTISDYVEKESVKAKVISKKEIEVRNHALADQAPILKVENLLVRYPSRKNWYGKTLEWLHAVDSVSFDVYPGETFGLAGESGCGKTSLGRAIARLTQAHSGTIRYEKNSLLELSEEAFKPFRKEIQVVFQDPYSSLNPRMTVGEAIMEPMKVHNLYENKSERQEKTIELLQTVGLEADHFKRYPHEFSGGQRQRICIARALSLDPKFLICDEMVSALDVSVQATILNLLMDLQDQYGLTYLFISHDLSVIKQMCDRLMVMNNGKVEALGIVEEVFDAPPTPYVRRLIESIPEI